MIKKGVFIIIVFIGTIGFGQISKTTSIKIEKDTLLSSLKTHHFTEKKQISIRLGAGYQKAFYSEIGIALHTTRFGDTGVFSNDFYTAVEWTTLKEEDVYALKIGYEANLYLLNAGLEVKYQTNFKENDFVITPKIGLGIYGDVNLFYGYNISTNGTPFPQISKHQFSIVFNLNKHFLAYP